METLWYELSTEFCSLPSLPSLSLWQWENQLCSTTALNYNSPYRTDAKVTQYLYRWVTLLKAASEHTKHTKTVTSI